MHIHLFGSVKYSEYKRIKWLDVPCNRSRSFNYYFFYFWSMPEINWFSYLKHNLVILMWWFGEFRTSNRFESKRMQKTHIRFFRVWTISHQKAMNWKLNQYCNLIVTIHDVLLSELQHLIGARNDFLPKEYLDTIRMPGRILEPVKLKI